MKRAVEVGVFTEVQNWSKIKDNGLAEYCKVETAKVDRHFPRKMKEPLICL